MDDRVFEVRRPAMLPNPVPRHRSIRGKVVRVRGSALGFRDFLVISAAVALGIVVGGLILAMVLNGTADEDDQSRVAPPPLSIQY